MKSGVMSSTEESWKISSMESGMYNDGLENGTESNAESRFTHNSHSLYCCSWLNSAGLKHSQLPSPILIGRCRLGPFLTAVPLRAQETWHCANSLCPLEAGRKTAFSASQYGTAQCLGSSGFTHTSQAVSTGSPAHLCRCGTMLSNIWKEEHSLGKETWVSW